MKKALSVLLAVIMLVSVFSTAFTAFALDKPDNGWYKDENGKKHYSLDGQDIKDDVLYDDDTNKIYYFNSKGILVENKWTKLTFEIYEGFNYTVWIYSLKNGTLAQGWKKLDGKWYYFFPAMASNGGYLIEEENKAYVFDKSGALTTKTGWVSFKETLDDGTAHKYWYYVKKGGVATTGWKKLNNSWYYFDLNGSLCDDGVYVVDDNIYYFNKNGRWNSNKSGWVKNYDDWYYFENGKGVTGWKKLKNAWYYFDLNGGYMYSDGAYEVLKYDGDEKGTFYYFEKSGKLTTKTGWRKFETVDFFGQPLLGYYYVKKGGKCKIGWQKIKDNWYYFNPEDATMAADTGMKIGNKVYLFESSGKLTKKTGWTSLSVELIDGSKRQYKFYVIKDGVCATGWKKLGDITYYFDPDFGILYDDGVYPIGSDILFFNNDGSVDKLKKGLVEDYGDYYYFVNGKGVKGWYFVDGERRYFDKDEGYMYRNIEAAIDGYMYEFDEDGNATLTGEAPEDDFSVLFN